MHINFHKSVLILVPKLHSDRPVIPLRKKISSTSPMKSHRIVFVVVFLLLGTQILDVHCRALQVQKTTKTAEQLEGDESMAMAKRDVSSKNSLSRRSSSVGGFAFKLTSGPSKKGPGH
ncbi:hypothetical protein Vadar_009732 [Vaccinium darrowii]|uniref:Uncharacterized protein n=1 Tax=Vaccinium darrowii TaxID=229202 RepID=A0ACB7XYN1_9ERIC|nr:hypothetical protein Vadar_009732 [Vaccinium darrowii]